MKNSEVEAVLKFYKDIDLDIKSGETVGIIGGTGSGKSDGRTDRRCLSTGPSSRRQEHVRFST